MIDILHIGRFMFFAAWYDFWVGIYYDTKKRHLYIMPLPMIGFRIRFKFHCTRCKRYFYKENMYQGYGYRDYCFDCGCSETTFDNSYR